MSNLKKECEIVRDLLPLYVDEVTSEESRRFVERHLEGCTDCRRVKEQLVHAERTEERLHAETAEVLARHQRKERTLAWKIGIGIAGGMIATDLIGMLVMLLNGGSMIDGMLLLFGLAIAGGVTAVPLLSQKHKLANAIIVTTVSIVLMELAYTNEYGGDFWATAVTTVLGISVPLFPVVICAYPLPGVLRQQKGLVTMVWDSAFALLTVLTVGIATYGWMPNTKPIIFAALKGMALSLVMIWVIFLAARYLKLQNRWIKAALVSVLVGAALFVIQNPVNQIISREESTIMLLPNFGQWTDATYNANVSVIVLLCGVAVGAVLFVIGVVRGQKRK